jgi:hypothetical protein
MDDLAVAEHIEAIRHFEAETRVLLDEQDRDPLRPHRGDDAEHLAHQERRQALRRPVEQQRLVVDEKRPRDRQDLLLAARKLPSEAVTALRQVLETARRPARPASSLGG